MIDRDSSGKVITVLCKDCEWYRSADQCFHENAQVIEPVHGTKTLSRCWQQRDTWGAHYCGPEGKWWEKK